jgi:hypothetical protein
MSMKSKFRSNAWLVVKSVVVGSTLVTRVFGAPAPVAPSHIGLVDNWRVLGQQMGQSASNLPPLSDHLVDMISAADLKNDLSEVVTATYAMVDPSQVRALDAHWAAVLTAMGNAPLVAEFLNLRSGITTADASVGETDTLVWLASTGNRQGGCDGCNSGGGNGSENDSSGSDCDPGNSGGNNNGKD